MEAIVPAEEVGLKCVEWYSCIIARDIEESIRCKEIVKREISNMKPNDKVVTFYSLISFRHDLLLEDIHSKLDEDRLKYIRDTDPLLKFFYYFMSGQSEFYKAHYRAAIRLYTMAEGYLNNVEDSYEKAEFYHRIGEGYYRIYQYTFASAYLEKALAVFSNNPNYKERELFTRLVIAGIATERDQYEEAETRYQALVSDSTDFPFAQALIFQGLAFNRLRRDMQDEAEDYIIKALTTGNHANSLFGLKSKGELAFINLRIDNFSEGIPLLEEVEEKAKELGDREYQLRCYINRHLYVEYDADKVREGIDGLEKAELYFDAVEVSQEVARFYEKRGKFEEALEYMKLAIHLKSYQAVLGGEIE